MNNHHYGDMSNLNAPYDAVPLQGYGLGQAVPPGEGIQYQAGLPDDPAYPWRKFSQSTLSLQMDINEGLTAAGGCLLLEDGEMGARTCGALQYFGDSSNKTCLARAHEEAPIFPTIPCPPQKAPAADKGPGSDLVAPPKTEGIPGWVIGVGLGALAIGVAMMLKKKK